MTQDEIKEDFKRLRRSHEQQCEDLWNDLVWDFQMQHNLDNDEIEALEVTT